MLHSFNVHAEVVNVDVAFLHADVLLIVVVFVRLGVRFILVHLVVVDVGVVLFFVYLVVVNLLVVLLWIVVVFFHVGHELFLPMLLTTCHQYWSWIILVDVVVNVDHGFFLSILSMNSLFSLDDVVDFSSQCCCQSSRWIWWTCPLSMCSFDALVVLDLFRCRGRCACCTWPLSM